MENILIVIDMQNDFIDGRLGTKEAKAIVPKVIRKIEEFKGNVVFTRDTHTTDYLKTAEGKKLPVEHCISGTEGWNLHKDIDQIRQEKNAKVFDKITFGSKELAQFISSYGNIFNGIGTIEICGLCTDICVISNAMVLKAYMPETPIIVDSSCCAGVTPKSHENALEAMKMCQIDIV